MISLIKSFFVNSVKQRRREPMGGFLRVCAVASSFVLFIFSGLDVYASSGYTSAYFSNAYIFKMNSGSGPDYSVDICNSPSSITWSLYPTSIDVIDITSGLNLGSFNINAVDDSLSISYNSSSREEWWQNSTGTAGGSTSSTNGSGTVQAPEYTIDFDDVSFDSNVTLIAHYDRTFDYYLYYRNLMSGSKPSSAVYDVQSATSFNYVDVEYRKGIGMDWVSLSSDYYKNIGFKDYWGFVRIGYIPSVSNDMIPLGIELSYIDIKENVTSFNMSDFLLQVKLTWRPSDKVTPSRVEVTFSSKSEYILNEIEKTTDVISDQQKEYHDQDQSDATSAGQAMSGVATDLENVKNKWEILWYPIEFTNNLMSAFQGTQAAAYNLSYGNISGYTYNESSGLLEPVYSKVRSGSSGSATITFPEYTLPVLNVKLWDSYSYDMSSLKDQFPALFDALYVFVSMIEVFLFVGFLRKKYEEVFRR